MNLFDSDWSPVPGSDAADDFCGIAFVDVARDAFIELDPSRGVTPAALKKAFKKLPPSIDVIPPRDDGSGSDNATAAAAVTRTRTTGSNSSNSSSSSSNSKRETVFPGHTPKWYPFMFETPGDGEGQLLASVQIIPCFQPSSKEIITASPSNTTINDGVGGGSGGRGGEVRGRTNSVSLNDADFFDRHRPPLPDISPPTRRAWLEVVAVGCRNLKPYRRFPLSLPHVELTLDTPKGPVTHSTKESKQPTPK